MKRHGSRLFLIAGACFLLFAAYLVWERTNPYRLSFETAFPTQTVATIHSVLPTQITISSIGVDLPIIPATIRQGSWETTAQGVSYVVSSAIPGEKGNSVIYGHNWSNIFGRLPNITRGDRISVFFSDGSSRSFTVQYTTIVTPDQTHVIEPTDDARLTLYTCTGFFDTKRFVTVATPL